MPKLGPVRSPAALLIGVIMLAAGLLFMFQGLGTVHGSPMTNSNFWAAAGPIIAIVGAIIALQGLRRMRDRGGSRTSTDD